jgi:hypothetical protein
MGQIRMVEQVRDAVSTPIVLVENVDDIAPGLDLLPLTTERPVLVLV